MLFKSMKRVHKGCFISRYDITYETADHKEKVYEMISRSDSMDTLTELRDKKPDGVVLILHDRSHEKILLNREFRMAVGGFVYNFPAGLIDPNEEPKESAARELKEETGLDLAVVEDMIGLSYSAVGFSNEKNVCVVGIAEGDFAPSTSTAEEIEAGWYTKAEVRKLLEEQPFAARTQTYCYLWSKS